LDASTSWLTADAQIDCQMIGAGAGPLTLGGFSSTTTTIWASLNRDFLILYLLVDCENSPRFVVQLSGNGSTNSGHVATILKVGTIRMDGSREWHQQRTSFSILSVIEGICIDDLDKILCET